MARNAPTAATSEMERPGPRLGPFAVQAMGSAVTESLWYRYQEATNIPLTDSKFQAENWLVVPLLAVALDMGRA